MICKKKVVTLSISFGIISTSIGPLSYDRERSKGNASQFFRRMHSLNLKASSGVFLF